jgi:hypothetical protein
MPTGGELAIQRQRWLSGKHVGHAKPVLRAFVRKGALHRHYKPLPQKDVFSFIPGLNGPNWVWYAEWKANSDYVEVPNVKEVRGSQNIGEQNGIQQVTMTIDNIGMIQEEGSMGALFHTIKRGWYAPLRGNKPPITGGDRVGGSKNGWFDRWKDKATQVMIVCGYGEAVFPVFLGLVDNVNLTSSPDQIVVTLRDMGQFLTDQHTFLDAKNLYVKDPITFCDRQKADERHNQASTANARNEKPGNPARLAVDGSKESAALSAEYGGANGLWWIDVPIPAGRYEDLNLMPAYDGLTCKVSVFATNANLPEGKTIAQGTDGTLYGAGWINAGGSVVADGIHEVASFAPKQGNSNYAIKDGGGGFIVGDGSKVRLWFTDLKKTGNDSGRGWCYRAGVANLEVFSRTRLEAAKTENWILVDDVSDIVKTVLQWVGLTEWEVETCGVRLKDKVVFDRQTYLIDIIKRIAELTSYVFFVRPPLEFDIENLSKSNEANLSMGIAVFRQGSSMQQEPRDGSTVEVIKDTSLLTAVQATFDANALPNSIRVRGKAIAAKDASPNAHVLGADPAVRYQYSYRPPWATADNQNAGQAHLRRQEVHYDNLLKSVYECKVACLFIAFRAALESAKAEVELPMWPGIGPDDQVLLFDTGTGLSTRMWVTNISWNYSSGEQKAFKMNLGGALLDTNDAAEVQKQLEAVLAEEGRNPGKIARGPWENVHRF